MKRKRYEAYKESGIEWIGEIPAHWEVRKITHIFRTIGSGTTPTAGEKKYYDGDIYWLQTGDLTDGIVTNTSKKITKKALKDFTTLKVYPTNSLVIALYGATIGKVGFLKINTTTNQACCVLSNPQNLLEKYAFYWFLSSKNHIVSMAYGGGQPNISQELIKSLRMCVPPKQEQIQIADYLDQKTAQIDKAITLKERLIALLKEQRQILINRAVTQGLDPDVPMKESGVEWIGKIPAHWEVKRAKYIFKEINIRTETGREELLSLSKYRGVVPKSSLEERAGMAESLIGYKKVFRNTLVINKMQAVNGLIGVSKLDGITSPDYAIYDVISSDFNIHYYGELLKQNIYLAQFKKVVTGVMEGFIRLYTDDLFQIYMLVPPRDEQDKIVDYLDKKTTQIDKAITLQQNQIEKLKAYKTSLIDAVVTGKVKIADE